MDYISDRGRHVELPCQRCGWKFMVPVLEMQANSARVTCSDCLHYLKTNPEQAEREFQVALRRSEQDSLAMRARWAAQDAARDARTA